MWFSGAANIATTRRPTSHARNAECVCGVGAAGLRQRAVGQHAPLDHVQDFLIQDRPSPVRCPLVASLQCMGLVTSARNARAHKMTRSSEKTERELQTSPTPLSHLLA